MQVLLFILVLLLVAGIVYYGMAKIVILCVLAVAAVCLISFLIWGIIHEARSSRPFDPQNPSADQFRAIKKAAETLKASEALAAEEAKAKAARIAQGIRPIQQFRPIFMTVHPGEIMPWEMQLTAGRFFRAEDMMQPLMLVTDAILASNGEKIPLSNGYRIGGTTFTVIGTFKGTGPMYGRDDAVLVPYTFCKALGFSEASAVTLEKMSILLTAGELPPNVQITSGRFFDAKEMTAPFILVEDEIASSRQWNPASGHEMPINGINFTVIGTFRVYGRDFEKEHNAVLMPASFCKALGIVEPSLAPTLMAQNLNEQAPGAENVGMYAEMGLDEELRQLRKISGLD